MITEFINTAIYLLRDFFRNQIYSNLNSLPSAFLLGQLILLLLQY